MADISYFFPDGTPRRTTSPFGTRNHPVTKKTLFHKGQDEAAPEGTPVRTIFDGNVIVDYDDTNSSPTWGITVGVKDSGGRISYYTHLQSNSVTNGQAVTSGQTIGAVGRTGLVTGSTLHYQQYDTTGTNLINPASTLSQSYYSQFKNGDKDAEKDEFERALQARDERKSITKVTTDEATEKALDGQKAGAQQNQDAKDKEADEVAKEQEKSDGGSTSDPKSPPTSHKPILSAKESEGWGHRSYPIV